MDKIYKKIQDKSKEENQFNKNQTKSKNKKKKNYFIIKNLDIKKFNHNISTFKKEEIFKNINLILS